MLEAPSGWIPILFQCVDADVTGGHRDVRVEYFSEEVTARWLRRKATIEYNFAAEYSTMIWRSHGTNNVRLNIGQVAIFVYFEEHAWGWILHELDLLFLEGVQDPRLELSW